MTPAGSTGSVWAVVVAAGSSTRFGADKVRAPLADGTRVLDRSLEVARLACDGVVLVVAAGHEHDPEPEADVVVVGGATRSASVRAGVAAVPVVADVIVVHDGARPFATLDLWRRVIGRVHGHPAVDAVVPAVDVVDTIKVVDGDVVVSTPDRATLAAVQTPQAFPAPSLRAALSEAADASDDAGLVEAVGGKVVVVAGEITNRKITRPADLAPAVGDVDRLRVGHGFDSHALDTSGTRPCVLGGVTFADSAGFAGHSDADAVCHAIVDSLLGATGQGDIGAWYPDDDPDLAGADSTEMLGQVVSELGALGWRVVNVDVTIVADSPRIGPRRDEMVRRLSEVIGAPVGVTAGRPEGMAGLQPEGTIMCWATCLVVNA